MEKIDSLVSKIKGKKELSGIPDKIIEERLEKYLKKQRISASSLDSLKESELKIIIKDLRSTLRENVGRFKSSSKNRQTMLKAGDFVALLKTHSSTKERINFYPKLKEIISKINPKSILDLGCGINPIALASPEVNYYASDINEQDLNIVKAFFSKSGINGKVFVCDLTKIEDCSIPEADLTLILKVFDILSNKDYDIAKKVLENIKSKHIIVSFSTITLSGKPMNNPRRIWFEKLLKSLLYNFDIVHSNNELFYII